MSAPTPLGLSEGNDLLSTGNVSVAQDTYNQWPAELRARLEDGLARPAAQQPTWPDRERATAVRWMLGQAPPITFPGEVDRAREALGRVATGSAFVLQGGDCAETFAGNTAEHIRGNIRTLLQMAAVLTYGASMPIVTLGRMAGQYAKPRSSDVDSAGLPVYRGDMVNSLTPEPKARVAEPTRMLRAYANAASTMNMIRAVAASGLSSVDQVHKWNKDFINTSAAGPRHERLATGVERALRYIEACGVDRRDLNAAEIFASHEALVLDYEQGMLRLDESDGTHRLYTAFLFDRIAHTFLTTGEVLASSFDLTKDCGTERFSSLDSNGDGSSDLIVGEELAIRVGPGNWKTMRTNLPANAEGIRILDLNGDGLHDVLIRLPDGTLQLALNQGVAAMDLGAVPDLTAKNKAKSITCEV